MRQSEALPEVGSWYKDDAGDSFEVIAVDSEAGSVEVQFFDGTLDSFDLLSWQERLLTPREPPEDWSGPFDNIDADQLADSSEVLRPEHWTGPLDLIE